MTSQPATPLLDHNRCCFCGSTLVQVFRITTDDHDGYAAACECGSRGPIKPSSGEAIEAWNSVRLFP